MIRRDINTTDAGGKTPSLMLEFTKIVLEYIFLHPINTKYAIITPCEKISHNLIGLRAEEGLLL